MRLLKAINGESGVEKILHTGSSQSPRPRLDPHSRASTSALMLHPATTLQILITCYMWPTIIPLTPASPVVPGNMIPGTSICRHRKCKTTSALGRRSHSCALVWTGKSVWTGWGCRDRRSGGACLLWRACIASDARYLPTAILKAKCEVTGSPRSSICFTQVTYAFTFVWSTMR